MSRPLALRNPRLRDFALAVLAVNAMPATRAPGPHTLAALAGYDRLEMAVAERTGVLAGVLDYAATPTGLAVTAAGRLWLAASLPPGVERVVAP